MVGEIVKSISRTRGPSHIDYFILLKPYSHSQSHSHSHSHRVKKNRVLYIRRYHLRGSKHRDRAYTLVGSSYLS